MAKTFPGFLQDTDVKNGFVHINVRSLKEDCPRSFKINGRLTTLLFPGERLFKPCFYCGLRNHHEDECPHKYKYDEYLGEKSFNESQKKTSSPNNSETSGDNENSPEDTIQNMLKEPITVEGNPKPKIDDQKATEPKNTKKSNEKKSIKKKRGASSSVDEDQANLPAKKGLMTSSKSETNIAKGAKNLKEKVFPKLGGKKKP